MSNANEQNRRMRAGFNDSRREIFQREQAEKRARKTAEAERQRRAALPPEVAKLENQLDRLEFLLMAVSMFTTDGPTLRELYETIAAPLDQLAPYQRGAEYWTEPRRPYTYGSGFTLHFGFSGDLSRYRSALKLELAGHLFDDQPNRSADALREFIELRITALLDARAQRVTGASTRLRLGSDVSQDSAPPWA